MGHVGTLSVRLETFLGLVGDICRGLKANGFERMILINGHGGNAAPLQTLSVALAEEDVWALAFSYWEVIEDELRAWGEDRRWVDRPRGRVGDVAPALSPPAPRRARPDGSQQLAPRGRLQR